MEKQETVLRTRQPAQTRRGHQSLSFITGEITPSQPQFCFGVLLSIVCFVCLALGHRAAHRTAAPADHHQSDQATTPTMGAFNTSSLLLFLCLTFLLFRAAVGFDALPLSDGAAATTGAASTTISSAVASASASTGVSTGGGLAADPAPSTSQGPLCQTWLVLAALWSELALVISGCTRLRHHRSMECSDRLAYLGHCFALGLVGVVCARAGSDGFCPDVGTFANAPTAQLAVSCES